MRRDTGVHKCQKLYLTPTLSTMLREREWAAAVQHEAKLCSAQSAACVTCSREEITFPSCTSSKMVRIWRVVTGPARGEGTVLYGSAVPRVCSYPHLNNCYYSCSTLITI